MSLQYVNIQKTAANLKRLCQEKGLKPNDIMEKLRLTSVQSVYKWFAGKTLPSIDNLITISYLLDVTLEEILVIDEQE